MTTCIVEVRQWEAGKFKLAITPELSNGDDTTEIDITPEDAKKLEYLNNPEYSDNGEGE